MLRSSSLKWFETVKMNRLRMEVMPARTMAADVNKCSWCSSLIWQRDQKLPAFDCSLLFQAYCFNRRDRKHYCLTLRLQQLYYFLLFYEKKNKCFERRLDCPFGPVEQYWILFHFWSVALLQSWTSHCNGQISYKLSTFRSYTVFWSSLLEIETDLQ